MICNSAQVFKCNLLVIYLAPKPEINKCPLDILQDSETNWVGQILTLYLKLKTQQLFCIQMFDNKLQLFGVEKFYLAWYISVDGLNDRTFSLN